MGVSSLGERDDYPGAGEGLPPPMSPCHNKKKSLCTFLSLYICESLIKLPFYNSCEREKL